MTEGPRCVVGRPSPPLVLSNLFTEADILQIVIFTLFEKLAP